jgi:hypothetical protein
MNPFQKLPGFERAAPGLERAIWRRLPAVLLWGTLAPLAVALLHRWFTPVDPMAGEDGALLLWDYMLIGVVALHWSLVLTVACGCVVVMVMKGPAYVADAYPLPQREDGGARTD